MRVFLAVVDTGSIPAAARALQVTEMSVRNNLHELESSVGCKALLAKAAGALVPTGHGEHVASVARSMLAQAAQLSRPERLRPVVAFSPAQAQWVVDALRACGSLDEVELRVLPGSQDGGERATPSLAAELLTGAVDLLVSPLEEPLGEDLPLQTEALYRSQLLALVSPPAKVATLRELSEDRILALPNGWAAPMLRAAAQVEAVPLTVDTTSPDPHALVVLAEAGLGTAVLPADVALLVAPHPATGSWAPILHRGRLLDSPVCLLSRRDASRRMERVRSSLRAAAASRALAPGMPASVAADVATGTGSPPIATSAR
nr:LysR family transcriptional regulator [Motilibacter deserti]